jgi:Polyketide cyclase / dehydrase and lipid transport
MNTLQRTLIGLLLLAALVGCGLGMLQAGIYGLTLFVLFPVILGALASWILRAKKGSEAVAIGAFSVMTGCLLLLATGWEGVICMVMALPLAMPLGSLGAWLVYRAQNSRQATRGGIAVMFLLAPTTFTFDTHAQPPVFEVRSAITIAAPPEQVWKHVVSFPDLPEPHEWFFLAGVAYPQRARIEGSGVGATRYCEFSTGPFVEPIEVWDEPSLLRFRVSENPAPMREWSPYGQVLAKHLHGYLISKRGQFKLTRLAGNRTLLEGTTWYQHGLWPTEYWRWWSDAIIHRIHLRVLNHIRTLAEQDAH